MTRCVQVGRLDGEDHSMLAKVATFMKARSSGSQTADHIWVHEVEDASVAASLESIAENIADSLGERFQASTIIGVPEVDEVYSAVSPATAGGSDRSLVDCHYDAPLGWLPGSAVFYRVIVGCTDNTHVQTKFPKDTIDVFLSTGDFVGMDYSRDLHCVRGGIPEGHMRVLLKLHYIIAPTGTETLLTTHLIRCTNVLWTRMSRYLMRASADPTGPVEHMVALLVNLSRVFMNNMLLVIGALVVILAVAFSVTF